MVSSSKGAGLSQTGQVHVGFFSFICRKNTASKHWRWAQVRTRHGTPSRIFTSWIERETQEVKQTEWSNWHQWTSFKEQRSRTTETVQLYSPQTGQMSGYSLDRWGRLGGLLLQFRSLDQIVVCLGLQVEDTMIMSSWNNDLGCLRLITQWCCCYCAGVRDRHLLRSRQRSALSTEHSLSWLKRSAAVKTLTK